MEETKDNKEIRERASKSETVTRLMFRLLPIQVLFMAVSSVNGIVSSFFAANYVGIDAMGAVGLYGPVTLFLGAVVTTLSAGSAIICGKYLGQNEQTKLRNVFALNLVLAGLAAIILIVIFVILGTFDLTGFMTKDPDVRPVFNQYLLGQAIGLFPLLLGNQLPAYLIMENRSGRTTTASVAYIIANIILNYVFVKVMHLEAFGLALASSFGLWVFMAVEAEYFISGKSHFKCSFRHISWEESSEIIRIGLPGATGTIFQSIRGVVVNWLILMYVGSVGISAFGAANNLMCIFWALPAGMQAVSRLLLSISIGEEDRQMLQDIMRGMLRYYVPLQCAVSVLLILCAVPLTHIFYRDPSEPVYMMTVWGIRILPLCMPLTIICMHFVSYWQALGKDKLVHLISILDGAVGVCFFTAVLIPFLVINSVYIANVLNSLGPISVILVYSWMKNHHAPRNMEELMAIPDDLGVPEKDRMDISVHNMGEVVKIAEKIQQFCLNKGIDERRSYLAGLAMEEMAGNVVEHGFTKDDKKHHVDVCVVHKDGCIILRILDDCVPFDPGERQKLAAGSGDDIAKNLGLRMIFRMSEDIQYQNILGLNALTIKI